jgi:hypothetical protein
MPLTNMVEVPLGKQGLGFGSWGTGGEGRGEVGNFHLDVYLCCGCVTTNKPSSSTGLVKSTSLRGEARAHN